MDINKELMIQPRIFISYSWTNDNHQKWVMNLAERLISDGVNVVIDKWDLKEGQDIYTFMESMVQSNEISKVLIILDKQYTEKAEQRTGGVGAETQIISPEIYGNVSQEKFIPIVAEVDNENDNKPYIPTYLKGRVYINLSKPEEYESNYEQLLRNLYDRPQYNKPKTGKAPSYLFDESPISFSTSVKVRSIESEIHKFPGKINILMSDFFDCFHNDLKELKIELDDLNSISIGKKIHDSIITYTPLRENFISFMLKIIKSKIDFDISVLLKFFEKLPNLTHPDIKNESIQNSQSIDNLKFMFYELFLYVIAIGLKFEEYNLISKLFHHTYFINDFHNKRLIPQRFIAFNCNINSIDSFYYETYSKKFISPVADLIVSRVNSDFDKTNLLDADLLCHYVGSRHNLNWFPKTFIYRENNIFEIFDKMLSRQHFDKVKIIFRAEDLNHFKLILKENEITESKKPFLPIEGYENLQPLYKKINQLTVGSII